MINLLKNGCVPRILSDGRGLLTCIISELTLNLLIRPPKIYDQLHNQGIEVLLANNFFGEALLTKLVAL